MSLALLEGVVFVVALAATILGGPRRFMRGRHVSKVVTRRVGYRRALTLRQVLIWGGIPFSLIGHPVIYCVLTGAVAVWALDDLLFTDDDRKRRHEWEKIRLRMPKLIKLRPVESWAA